MLEGQKRDRIKPELYSCSNYCRFVEYMRKVPTKSQFELRMQREYLDVGKLKKGLKSSDPVDR